MKQHTTNAFSLIELMVVVTTIGLLALLGVPGIRKTTERAEATSAANNIRVFADAVEFYATSHGSYPSYMTYTNMPPDVSAYLPSFWKDGSYSWFYNSTEDFTYVYVYGMKFTPEQGVQLDTILDDGNIATGNLRVAYNGSGMVYLFANNSGLL
ncbi:type II secretion system protein [Coraliomargarita parva]|uniref:type II secretion system protein n=1 Tax=Coraliomargarita parva TaxID=3014050 RepID=UPI0022B3DE4D|nr:hypothetical protein [Coraliomargarita parva]